MPFDLLVRTPRVSAIRASPANDEVGIFRMRWLRCPLTVISLTPSSSAISLFIMPGVTRANTSRSCAVSESCSNRGSETLKGRVNCRVAACGIKAGSAQARCVRREAADLGWSAHPNGGGEISSTSRQLLGVFDIALWVGMNRRPFKASNRPASTWDQLGSGSSLRQCAPYAARDPSRTRRLSE
jgi:hypothetical protein